MSKVRTYSEAVSKQSFGDRLSYLQLQDGNLEHSSPRSISNHFYKSRAWQQCRDDIIRRDLGCDLGVSGMYIDGPIIVHHINPINEDDILTNSPKLYDHDNLICVSIETHNKIHYNFSIDTGPVERTPGDTKLW